MKPLQQPPLLVPISVRIIISKFAQKEYASIVLTASQRSVLEFPKKEHINSDYRST